MGWGGWRGGALAVLFDESDGAGLGGFAEEGVGLVEVGAQGDEGGFEFFGAGDGFDGSVHGLLDVEEVLDFFFELHDFVQLAGDGGGGLVEGCGVLVEDGFELVAVGVGEFFGLLGVGGEGVVEFCGGAFEGARDGFKALGCGFLGGGPAFDGFGLGGEHIFVQGFDAVAGFLGGLFDGGLKGGGEFFGVGDVGVEGFADGVGEFGAEVFCGDAGGLCGLLVGEVAEFAEHEDEDDGADQAGDGCDDGKDCVHGLTSNGLTFYALASFLIH